ncbi:coiled-coil domain-containing protein 106-like [Colossoma macropomum]|uniref:coiled-coil domain-containing protein 106-like n=1 Tax=Colossoma macropomum TaxID=42526 RepID=UPI001864C211|nr:coiled-coil domain-containing protein 106-like [Colossoma macropomum]
MSLKKQQILLAEAKKNEEAMSKTVADLKEERDSLLKQLAKSGNPQQAVRRYRKILQQYRRGKNLHAAYKAISVDRNTVVANAPIAELAIVAPQEYSKLLEGYSRQEKLQVFAKKCMDAQLLTTVEMYKKKNKLLPLMKRK